VTDVWLEDEEGNRINSLTSHEPVSLCLNADVSDQFIGKTDLEVAFSINTIDGHRLFTVVSSWTNDALVVKSPHFAVACDLPVFR